MSEEKVNISANSQDVEERASQIKTIRKELDHEFSSLLNDEISELEKISIFAESVEKKLKKHYSHIFPKKCNTCGTVFDSLETYLKETKRLKKTTTVFDEIGLQEYRNCHCGSTLVVWTQERRDVTSYGKSRRKLFDECMEKLSKISSLPEDDLKNKLRKIFSSLAR
mgnify:CR=1 FL=1